MTRARALAEEQRNRLVEMHNSLAASLAARAKLRLPQSIDVEDLAQHGRLGLLKAAEKYLSTRWDARGKPPFSAFARRYVWGAIIDSGRRRHYANAKHEQIGPSTPTAVTQPDIDRRIDARRKRRMLGQALASLSAVEQKVIGIAYGRGETQRQIGAALGLDNARVTEIHRGALVKLRRGLAVRGVKAAA